MPCTALVGVVWAAAEEEEEGGNMVRMCSLWTTTTLGTQWRTRQASARARGRGGLGLRRGRSGSGRRTMRARALGVHVLESTLCRDFI